jgi:hypothetical protein
VEEKQLLDHLNIHVLCTLDSYLKLKCMDLQVYIYSRTNRCMFIRMLFLYDLYNEIELALHNVKKGKIYLCFNTKLNPFQSNFFCQLHTPQLLFVLGSKEVGGLLVIILQF